MVREYKGFLNESDCLLMIGMAQNQFSKSTTLGNTIEGYRIAEGTWLRSDNHIIINHLNKISEISGFSIENMELVHIVKYEKGGEYKTHHDFFHPGESYYEGEMKRGGQRVKSALLYLNENFTGGETEFPRINMKITPEIGKLVIWDNLLEDGTPDYDSLHAGLPVTSGTKYIAVVWIRCKKFV